ncbi:unnamed protein product [Prorocentrum cordatum]|uniref:Glycosyl transferase family 25 domain-containing protein n=1 Tax=Prorocentrum cordatum TaxID=2364126 RepID=A0ABN9VIU8_9DINO|nr:unnamed protein product [Polarella glacialis]
MAPCWARAALLAGAAAAAQTAERSRQGGQHGAAQDAAGRQARAALGPNWGAAVISLDRRPDRLRRFARALNASEPWLLRSGRLCRVRGRDGRDWLDHHHGEGLANGSGRVPLRMSEAVDGGWFSDGAVRMLRSAAAMWPAMTAGGAGLYLGHADAWQQVVRRGWDYGLIFEDDLTLFAPSFEAYASKALVGGIRSVDWDLLYLQHDNCAQWKKNAQYPFAPGQLSEEQEAQGQVFDTAAYVVTQRGARRLLAEAFPAGQQLDAALSGMGGLRRALLLPPVAQADETVIPSSGMAYRDTDVQQGAPTDAFRRLRGAVEGLAAATAAAAGPSEAADRRGGLAIPDCGA